MNFSGKVVVITGGSSGIGKSLALNLAKEGSKIIIIGKTKSKVVSTLNEIRNITQECNAYVCNVNEEKRVKYVVDDIIRNHKKIDFLINCAGFSNYKEFKDESIEEINEIIGTNFLGTLYFCKQVIPQMEKQKEGHIINIASIAGKFGFPNLSIYCGCKHAVIGFSESLYYELKDLGIKVSVVCPGGTDTEFYRDESWKRFPHDKRHKTIMTSEYVAKEIKEVMENGKFEVIIPKSYKLKIILKEALKPLVMRYISKLPRYVKK